MAWRMEQGSRRRHGWFGSWYEPFGSGTNGSAIGTNRPVAVRTARRMEKGSRQWYGRLGGRGRGHFQRGKGFFDRRNHFLNGKSINYYAAMILEGELINVDDIKITLSKYPKKRAPDIKSEAQRLKKKGTLYYELHKKPRHASAGCWVYFIRDGELVARAKASDFLWMKKEELGGSFTGELPEHDGWRVEVQTPMQIATQPIAHKGFQGFRYVRLEERVAFEQAFDKST